MDSCLWQESTKSVIFASPVAILIEKRLSDPVALDFDKVNKPYSKVRCPRVDHVIMARPPSTEVDPQIRMGKMNGLVLGAVIESDSLHVYALGFGFL